MDPTLGLIVTVAMVAFAALVQGYGGFGFGIVSIALLSLLPVPIERASVVVTLVSIVMLSLLLIQARRSGPVRWGQVLLLGLGAPIGVPLGYAFIAAVGDRPVFSIVLGLVLMGFALQGLLVRAKPRRMPRWLAFPIGCLSGFIGGAFVSGGPPIVLYCYAQSEDPREMKATVQASFLVMGIARLIAIALGERGYDQYTTLSALACLPLAIPLLLLGHRWSQGHASSTFRRVIYLLIACFGLAVGLQGALKALG